MNFKIMFHSSSRLIVLVSGTRCEIFSGRNIKKLCNRADLSGNEEIHNTENYGILLLNYSTRFKSRLFGLHVFIAFFRK